MAAWFAPTPRRSRSVSVGKSERREPAARHPLQGLGYLLSLALRMLTLVEWGVRERLRQEGSKLQGIYAGQPGRQTARPSAELLLGVMKTISVSVVEINEQMHAM